MPTCPRCDNRIPLIHVMRHSRWTPIICKKCHSKLHFNKKEWLKMTVPLFAIAVSNVFITSFVIKTTLSILLIIFAVFFFIRLKSIKLEVKKGK